MSSADPPAPGQAPAGEVEVQVEQQVAAPPVAVAPAVEAPAPSPRFENATGKPKVNVPAAAEAAPESSVSASGNSGRHKLTICHKGHAITVDVHAARAHVDGHGDTYAAAGAKGRAACPQPSVSSPPAPHHETPANTVAPAARVDVAAVVEATHTPTRPSVHEAAAAAPAGPKDPAGGVSAAADTQRSGVASAVAGGSLPFTGAPLETLVLFGLGLVGAGCALVAAARRPARARRR